MGEASTDKRSSDTLAMLDYGFNMYSIEKMVGKNKSLGTVDVNMGKKEKVDIMIDDDWNIIKKIAENKIRTLYFRDTNLMILEENKYIKEVNNWGEIYRYIKENMEK